MRAAIALVGLFAAFPCTSGADAQFTPLAPLNGAPSLAEPEARLLLIGDAGDADGRKHLQRVAAWVDAHAAPTTVVFLGDNFYPESFGERDKKLTAIFGAQQAVGRAREDVYFVPGNHDWHKRGIGEPNRARVDRLFAHVGAEHWKPAPGDLGPAELRFPHGLFRVIALDSELWLMAGETAAASRAASELDALLACADCPPAIVVAHHPLRTTGEHGGCELGFVRRRLKPAQDLAAATYQRYIGSLAAVLEKHPPLLFAAGHDHSLQFARDERFGAHVVSGAGASTSAVCGAPSANWRRNGFMTVEFARAAAPRLRVFAHDAAACGVSEFCEVLREPLAPSARANPPLLH